MPTDGSAEGIQGATTDIHFTTLGFTAGTGEPVMCAVIMKSKNDIPKSWIVGIDPDVPLVDGTSEEDFIRKNQSAMKGGPFCHFRGKTVPCFVGCSEKASITSELLMEMLKYMDKLGLYENEDGQRPFLLLDGHHSRFELPFLQYIMDKEHWWTVCIGVPYATHLWQVADSTEQNGCFKMALTKLKHQVSEKRNDMKFYPLDITLLLEPFLWTYSS